MSNIRMNPPGKAAPRIYLECYETATNGLKTGIQRVVRNIILNHDRAARAVGVEASPVRFVGDAFYPFAWLPKNDSQETGWGEALNRRIASACGDLVADRWTTRFSIVATRAKKALRFRKLRRRASALWLNYFGMPLRPAAHDMLVLVDVTWGLNVWPAVRRWREQGGKIAFVVYDLLPITHRHFVGASLSQRFANWFEHVLDNSDLILTISDTVRDQLRDVVRERDYGTTGNPPLVETFHLGAELDMRHADAYVRPSVKSMLSSAAGPAPYLIVGTVEPRKNHHTVLDAFEQLWQRQRDVRLFVIGRRGWECHDLERRMLNHPQFGKKLLWFTDLSDSELHRCYQEARGVVFASRGEGFGLPIVEGLQSGKPVIASDLPVHREVAGNHAAYFDPSRPEELVALIERLESLGCLPGVAPASEFRATTWLEGTTELMTRCRNAIAPPRDADLDDREATLMRK